MFSDACGGRVVFDRYGQVKEVGESGFEVKPDETRQIWQLGQNAVEIFCYRCRSGKRNAGKAAIYGDQAAAFRPHFADEVDKLIRRNAFRHRPFGQMQDRAAAVDGRDPQVCSAEIGG